METVQGNIDVEMRDDVAPLTVTNFMNYVDRGDFDNSFFHRSDPGFIIQGGGFFWDSNANTIGNVPADPPVLNEFNLSNTRGTITMAKVAAQLDANGNLIPGTGKDSATNQWFFNLADNSANLDNQNGGFTVFGNVVSGMNVVDIIENETICDKNTVNPAFTELPLRGGPSINCATIVPDQSNLVIINRVIRALDYSVDRNSVDFGLVDTGNLAREDIVVTNNAGLPLTFGNVTSIDNVTPPFLLDPMDDGCSGQIIQPGNTCTITVRFAPQTVGMKSGSLTIPTTLPHTSDVTVQLTGEAVAQPTPDLLLSPSDNNLTIGGIVFPDEGTADVTITNRGTPGSQITITSVSLVPAGELSIKNDGCSPKNFTLTRTDIDQPSCTITVSFKPLGDQTTNATMTINFANQPSALINVAGIGLEADIGAPLTFDLGDVKFGTTATPTPFFRIFNRGTGGLMFNNISLNVINPAPNDIIAGDITSGCYTFFTAQVPLPAGQFCNLRIDFTADNNPLTVGVRNATLTIDTNDPDEATTIIDITGTVSSDNDGIPDLEEDGGPNNGDADNNGTFDRLDEHVATFRATTGDYVTLITDTSGASLEKVRAIGNPAPNTAPTGINSTVNFPFGFFRFNITGLAIPPPVPGLSGVSATATLRLPSGSEPTHYFKYTPTLTNFNAHWYLFDYDGVIGAEINGNVVTLHFVDGADGDGSDPVPDGIIFDPGGPAIITADPLVTVSTDDSGGCSLSTSKRFGHAGDWWLVFIFLGWLGLYRRHYSKRGQIYY